jgi:hypothetical protein
MDPHPSLPSSASNVCSLFCRSALLVPKLWLSQCRHTWIQCSGRGKWSTVGVPTWLSFSRDTQCKSWGGVISSTKIQRMQQTALGLRRWFVKEWSKHRVLPQSVSCGVMGANTYPRPQLPVGSVSWGKVQSWKSKLWELQHELSTERPRNCATWGLGPHICPVCCRPELREDNSQACDLMLFVLYSLAVSWTSYPFLAPISHLEK